MCLMLYLATAGPIAIGPAGPLTIEAVGDDVLAKLRDTLSLPHVCVVTVDGCSCVFPSMPVDEPMPDEDWMERGDARPREIELMTALLSLLRPTLPAGRCELLPLWCGEEGEAARGRHALCIDDIEPKRFQFAEWFVHSIAA